MLAIKTPKLKVARASNQKFVMVKKWINGITKIEPAKNSASGEIIMLFLFILISFNRFIKLFINQFLPFD